MSRRNSRFTPKTKVEACVAIDINKLQREGALLPGKRAIELFTAERVGEIIATHVVAVTGTSDGAMLVDIKQDYQAGKITRRFFPLSVVWAPFGHG